MPCALGAYASMNQAPLLQMKEGPQVTGRHRRVGLGGPRAASHQAVLSSSIRFEPSNVLDVMDVDKLSISVSKQHTCLS